jgi:hypothetical protein
MKIACVYIYPNAGEGGYFEHAARFLQSYTDHPAGLEHDSVIVCNGTPASDETKFIFGGLSNVSFLDHDGSGYDIGGFQLAARTVACDLMVFFGSTAYVRQPNWLARMVQAYKDHGDTLYGSMGNQGATNVGVWPHVRTTGFWLSRALFNRYPVQVTRPDQRYPFEHGANGLTSWVISQNKDVWIVPASEGDWLLQACDMIPNGFHQGSQDNLLVGDKLSRPPYHPYE